ncbi:hypothetical protein, partial [Salmonella enterica]|uniref:hypothetical protein n=1 Tax=Salmonella enterica TaxID=28901 RepID=UPI000B1BF549
AHSSEFFTTLKFSGHPAKIAEKVLHAICYRVKFQAHVGLYYLTPSRSVGTRPGGEARRLRVARQTSPGVVCAVYGLAGPCLALAL